MFKARVAVSFPPLFLHIVANSPTNTETLRAKDLDSLFWTFLIFILGSLAFPHATALILRILILVLRSSTTTTTTTTTTTYYLLFLSLLLIWRLGLALSPGLVMYIYLVTQFTTSIRSLLAFSQLSLSTQRDMIQASPSSWFITSGTKKHA